MDLNSESDCSSSCCNSFGSSEPDEEEALMRKAKMQKYKSEMKKDEKCELSQ